MFKPNFDELKDSLKEQFKASDPANPFEEASCIQNTTAMDTAEKLLQEYHRQLWEELKRQGVVK